MVQVRLNAQPDVQRVIAIAPSEVPVVGYPMAHERDVRGRSWNIKELRGGDAQARTFRTIVDSLRDAFDLD